MDKYIKAIKSMRALAVIAAVSVYGAIPAFAMDGARGHDHAQAGSNRIMTVAASRSKAADGLRGGETRQTLTSSNFTGSTAISYRIAGEIPDVLDSLYCYCDCKRHSGHKSLLTCYVDEHAAYCDICQDEALMAYDLHMKGMSAKAIRAAVDRKYSGMSH